MARPGRPQAANRRPARPAAAAEGRTATTRRGWRRGQGLRPEGLRYPRGRFSTHQVQAACTRSAVRTPKPAPPARRHPHGHCQRISARRGHSTRRRGRSRIPEAGPPQPHHGMRSRRRRVTRLAGRSRPASSAEFAALALSYWALTQGWRAAGRLRAQVQGVQQALAGAEGRSGDVAQLTSRVDALERGSGAAVDEQVRGQSRPSRPRCRPAEAAGRIRAGRLGADAGS